MCDGVPKVYNDGDPEDPTLSRALWAQEHNLCLIWLNWFQGHKINCHWPTILQYLHQASIHYPSVQLKIYRPQSIPQESPNQKPVPLGMSVLVVTINFYISDISLNSALLTWNLFWLNNSLTFWSCNSDLKCRWIRKKFNNGWPGHNQQLSFSKNFNLEHPWLWTLPSSARRWLSVAVDVGGNAAIWLGQCHWNSKPHPFWFIWIQAGYPGFARGRTLPLFRVNKLINILNINKAKA